jgi:hypothetical protein
MITIKRPMQAGNLIRSRSSKTISFTFSTDNGDGYTKYNFTADAVVSIPSLEIEDMEIWQGGELYQTWFDNYHQIFSYACKFAKELVKEDMRKTK